MGVVDQGVAGVVNNSTSKYKMLDPRGENKRIGM